jgi:DNA-binding FrmR family transcriptional regulator
MFRKVKQRDHYKVSDLAKKKMRISINRLIGQLNAIQRDVDNESICDESLIQLLAIKGGLNAVVKQIFDVGLTECLKDKDQKRMNEFVALMLKSM